MKLLSTIFLFFITLCIEAQSLTEKLVLADDKDSLYLKAKQAGFDRKGNYCFTLVNRDSEYFQTNTGRTAAVKFIGSSYGNGGDVSYEDYATRAGNTTPWHYKNSSGAHVYGPVKGNLKHWATSGTKDHVAITVELNDTVFFYADDRLVGKNRKSELPNYGFETEDWCAFSENGNMIYSVRENGKSSLYVNGKLVQQSPLSFYSLQINNNGYYVYAEGQRPEVPPAKGYEYMFFVHTKDTVVGPVRTVWDSYLAENNDYYFSGDDNGPYYVIINNHLQKNIKNIEDITLGGDHYFYAYTEKGKPRVNAGGKVYDHPYEEIFLPAVAGNAHFAFYGFKDYYLYKYIDGRPVQQPITKYNVRPQQLYISPSGESLHYFKTDDSIYLYRDEQLIFPPISRSRPFSIENYNDVLDLPYRVHKRKISHALFYMIYDNQAFMVYNGRLSKPMMPAEKNTYANDPVGAISAGDINESGFFVIQKTGTDSYLININNEIYKEISGIERIFNKSCFFDDKELIFYGIKGSSFYQFKLTR